MDVNVNDPDSIKYIFNLFRLNTMVVTKYLLNSRNMPDIGSITISSDEYINESHSLKQEQSENIMFPEVLSTLQQKSKSWHDKLSHLRPKSMFRLATLGVLTSRFIEFKYDVRLSASCMFVTERSMQWITKGNKSESISKYTENKPGSEVSVDQLQSDQPVLVPQLSGKITIAHI